MPFQTIRVQVEINTVNFLGFCKKARTNYNQRQQ